MDMLRIVENQMQADDETTAVLRQKILVNEEYPLSMKTILASCEKLGWTFRGSACCQIIHQQNKHKRLQWARAHLEMALSNQFEDVLWTDELSITLKCHWRFSCQKMGTPAKPKPRAKHPCKVHVWAGISCQWNTPIVIFERLMNGAGLTEVFKAGLVPYINQVNNNPHLMQDNDPKHTSTRVALWFQDMNISWWKTTPKSPDLNPIENLFHELKQYIRRVAKLKTKDELVTGIAEFWETVDVAKGKEYIGHLKKVVSRVIEVNGGPTGYLHY